MANQIGEGPFSRNVSYFLPGNYLVAGLWNFQERYPVIIANAVTAVLSATLLFFKLRFKN
jgi:uncharacterized protein with PQ loop repeat